jgi:surface polysaccharide O-acyltransferase-like enzyme
MPPVITPARNASLDALRVLSLLGIVSLHVAGGGFAGMKPVGFVVDELSRFAVPVFFILSAYFWKPEELASPLRLTRRLALRVLVPFVLWVAFTIAWTMLDRPGYLPDLSPAGLVFIAWTGEPAFHLWFLPALVVGAALVATSGKYFGWKFTLGLALFLFIVGTTLGAYATALSGRSFPFWLDRNGLLFAPIFLVAGVLLRRHRDRVAALPAIAVVIGAMFFAALQIAEGYFIVGRYPMGHDYSLATLGYGIAVAMLFMRLELRGAWWSVLGRATFTAYLAHLLVLQLVVDHVTRFSPLVIGLTFAGALAIGVTWQAARAALRGKARGDAIAQHGSN